MSNQKGQLASRSKTVGGEVSIDLNKLSTVLQAAIADALQRLAQGEARDGVALETRRAAKTAAGAARGEIQIFEDDPFLQAVAGSDPVHAVSIPADVPNNTQPSLQTHPIEQQPAPELYDPSTAEFRYWDADSALARAINFWGPLLPSGTVWSTNQQPMQVNLDEGEDFNAFYARDSGLNFFHGQVDRVDPPVTVFSGASPDVSCHELGHAILDAVKPELFDAMSMEVAAFHEAFGDISSTLSAPPIAVDARLSAPANRRTVEFELATLPAGPSARLGHPGPGRSHSGGQRLPPQHLQQLLLPGPHRSASERPRHAALLGAALLLSRLLRRVPRRAGGHVQDRPGQLRRERLRQPSGRHGRRGDTPHRGGARGFRGAGLLQPGRCGDGPGRPIPYRRPLRRCPHQQLRAARILSPTAAVSLVRDLRAHGGQAFGITGRAPTGRQLQFEGESDGYKKTAKDAPALPLRPLMTRFGVTLHVHMPAEPARFPVAAAALLGGTEKTSSAEEDVRSFVEDLIQLDRISHERALGAIPVELTSPGEASPCDKTHFLIREDGKIVLNRHHFDCGFHSCRHTR